MLGLELDAADRRCPFSQRGRRIGGAGHQQGAPRPGALPRCLGSHLGIWGGRQRPARACARARRKAAQSAHPSPQRHTGRCWPWPMRTSVPVSFSRTSARSVQVPTMNGLPRRSVNWAGVEWAAGNWALAAELTEEAAQLAGQLGPGAFGAGDHRYAGRGRGESWRCRCRPHVWPALASAARADRAPRGAHSRPRSARAVARALRGGVTSLSFRRSNGWPKARFGFRR